MIPVYQVYLYGPYDAHCHVGLYLSLDKANQQLYSQRRLLERNDFIYSGVIYEGVGILRMQLDVELTDIDKQQITAAKLGEESGYIGVDRTQWFLDQIEEALGDD
jgi:hypothetical protein